MYPKIYAHARVYTIPNPSAETCADQVIKCAPCDVLDKKTANSVALKNRPRFGYLNAAATPYLYVEFCACQLINGVINKKMLITLLNCG